MKLNKYVAVVALLLALGATVANAQTDIPTAITTVSTWWTSIQTVALAVIVFLVGRKFFRKM